MICIDPRAGSQNLPKLFPSDMVLVFELPAADLLLTNQAGDDFWTAIEHKKINDLLQCMVTGRFAGTQLPAMAEAYDDYWLVVEGPMRQGKDGELEVPANWKKEQWYQAKVGNRRFEWSDFETWCITMQTLTPLKIKVTQSRKETIEWIMTLHAWWERGKDKHRSHTRLDTSRKTIEIIRPKLIRKIAEQLPGIGHDKAIRVEQYFGDTFEMIVANEDEWSKIEGVGKTMAQRIVRAIYGQEG